WAALAMAYSPDGNEVAIGQWRATVIYDMRERKKRIVLGGHAWGVCDVLYTPSGDQLITRSSDGQVRVWNTKSGKAEPTPSVVSGIVQDMASSADRRLVAV